MNRMRAIGMVLVCLSAVSFLFPVAKMMDLQKATTAIMQYQSSPAQSQKGPLIKGVEAKGQFGAKKVSPCSHCPGKQGDGSMQCSGQMLGLSADLTCLFDLQSTYHGPMMQQETTAFSFAPEPPPPRLS